MHGCLQRLLRELADKSSHHSCYCMSCLGHQSARHVFEQCVFLHAGMQSATTLPAHCSSGDLL